jgi:hypothetical protein
MATMQSLANFEKKYIMIFKIIMDGFWFYDVVFNGFMCALLCPEYFKRDAFLDPD